ncbi:hypothetical protein JD292_07355 [Leucobacter sp. CSA2]|uniref:Calcineurin-like phosphoesterase domain-containing protein n=1 Tax=Leucobacter edaphi TaxID=2796472 RepID=A0A934QC20_9MICO|nr:hypothetical protein [Leucobacter edaphi]MBK0421889.1 hypothetical protein [Leucobacter edaphi]
MFRTTRTSRLTGRRRGVLAGGAILAIAGGLLAVPGTPAPASAAPVEFVENFDGAPAADQAPGDWTVEHTNTAGMKPGWQGWSFHSTDEIVATWDGAGDRSSFSKGTGLVAVVESDKNRPTTGNFDSTLWSPQVQLSSSARAVEIGFDSHYKQGQAPQNARLVARFDGGDAKTVQNFAANRLNESAKFTVDVPAGAKTVQFGWSYLQSSNNWFWMIDNVRAVEAAPAAVTPVLESARKPVAPAGGAARIELSGLRAGQQLSASVGAGSAAHTVPVPAANADGRAAFDVAIPADQAPGVIPVRISGPDANPLDLGITVLAGKQPAYHSSEQQFWHSGFEGGPAQGEWKSTGASAWEMIDRAASLEKYGTDRRHAFTRASGTMAVAESSKAAFDGALSSPAIPVTGATGGPLELRLDSHLLRRGDGATSAKITAIYDTGARAELAAYGAEDRESEQLRIPLDIPSGAKTVTLEFAFTAPQGSGSWRIDDVELVRPLAPLAEAAQPSAVVDVFSDVQGSNLRLQSQVLPGLRALQPAAKTVVANGDLTSQGTDFQYTNYFNAFNRGGGDQYPTKISTIGNHEFFGANGSETYISRFLDRTGMRALGAEGADPAHAGLWGEVLVDGQLPVLWIGSEHHDYPSHVGSGPFVEMSDQQFTWLQGRLAHWREQNTPVVLFSHHVFNDSVSGTYARFYQGDFSSDTARLEGLLAQNPNVTVLTSHTHWAPELNDWSVEQRFDPAAKHGPTIVNTAAVTTQYGPVGDWEEGPVAGADPVGLRVGLYEDRLRVTAYAFGAGGAAKEVKHIDVPRPGEAPVDPEPQPEPAVSLGATSVAQGGELAVTGTGFQADEQLTVTLAPAGGSGDSADPASADGAPAARSARAAAPAASPVTAETRATANADGAFRATLTVPAEAPAGAYEVTVRRADGTTVAPLAFAVTASGTGPGEGPGGTPSPENGGDAGAGTDPAPGSPAAGEKVPAKTGGGLATTGGPVLVTAALLAALAAAAGGVVLLRRRAA